ncbi:MAG: D-alanyl-D-alanine carboxypeptidase, partial [Candidatus Andersenbacteria bacterium]|nr:D-alanyl-D-alanine carboxypeptidase [Candidatus Andersenbacteria bacterium]
MPKSTIIFALLCLTLAAAFSLVVWWLLNLSQPLAPAVAVSLSIGLPNAEHPSPKQLVRSESALLWDTEAQVISFEKNGFERRPIASLTKLMTAIVALDYGIDWDISVEILPAEYVIGGKLLLHPGERVTTRDLFHAMLMGSANNATLALVRQLPVDEREFIRAMNRKAIALGLEQTEFADVTGLDPDNVSTAYEIARLSE